MHLRLADVPQIELDDGRVVPLSPRDAGWLAWLVIEGPTSRHRLGALLWPASSDTQARTTLRQRLFQLKKQVGRDVAAGSPLLQLAEGVSHDLADASELLGDTHLPEAPELDAWLRRQREQRREREHDALRDQAQAQEAAGDFAGALAVAQALLRFEPLSEMAHRRVMRLHYLLGDRAAALQAFDVCEQVLKHEVGARPSSDTLALLATIDQAALAGAPAARRAIPAAVLRPPRMVGREREAGALQMAWTSGAVAAVIGEAGMGKSRLLAEFLGGQPGVACAAGRPGDWGVPFATLARLLRVVGAREASPGLAPDARRQLARVMPELLEPGALAVEGQRLQLRRALAAYLQAAPGLTGLVLDDLHFADTASLEMLQALIAEADQGGAELRWAVAYRPAEVDSALLALQIGLSEAARLAPIAVAPLDEAALAELVDQLGLGLNGAALAKPLRQRTGGNPLFVLETLKQAWVEQGIEPLSACPTLPKPMSVERLIDMRVGQLSPAALALARVAGIAGVDFTIGLAESVLGVGALRFADALGELESAQVLKGTQFAHDLVFDAVLRSVPGAIAEHTHAAVARWLEQHEGEPARVAQHWVAASQPAQAVPWLAQAAARAKSALRNVEHLAFLDGQADIEEALGRRADAFRTRLAALQAYDDNDRGAAGTSARCDALERLADDDGQRIRAWMERSSLAARRTETDTAEAFARQALNAAQTHGDTALVQRCQINLFEVLTLADRAREALALGEACLGWIGQHADGELRRNFHGALAMLYDNTGQLAQCVAHNELARELSDAHGDDANRATILGNLGSARTLAGQLEVGLALGLQSLRLASNLEGPLSGNAITCLNLAEAALLLGRYVQALRWAEEAERLLADSAPGGVPLAQAHRALCCLYLGQRARASQLVDCIAAHPAPVLSARIRWELLNCRLKRARGQATLPHVEAGLALLNDGARPNLRETLMIERALTLPAADALSALGEIGERAQRMQFGGHLLETRMRSAQIALRLAPALARDHALRALATAEEFGLVASYRGELWLHAAAALLASGDREHGLAVLGQGLAWVDETLRDHVPPEFHESFLHRNPVNVQLRALAARHGMTR